MSNPKAQANESAKVFDALRGACARIEKVIYIAGAADPNAFSEDLKEFFEQAADEVIERCLGSVPDGVELDDRDLMEEMVSEWLHGAGLMGYLVNVATPVMKRFTATDRSFSWSYYCTNWVYAESMDEAIAKGLAWVQERRDAEDAYAEKMKGVDIDAVYAKLEGCAA